MVGSRYGSTETDHDRREQIANAPTAREAERLGQDAPHRSDWNVVRLAVMLRLVREKFRQHPDLAIQLLATGDGRLINGVDFSRYWGGYGRLGGRGRNWLGRVLELVRAELAEVRRPLTVRQQMGRRRDRPKAGSHHMTVRSGERSP